MSTVGSIAVNVVANTTGFDRPIRGARQELSLFEKTATSALGNIKNSIFGFGTAFAASFAVNSIVETIGKLDDLSDAAERLGTTAAKLGGLQHAGFMADVSDESLARALTLMEKNVATGADAFDNLGLSVGYLRRLDATEMFVEIADAINKMPTPAERTAAAMAVFGKNGAEMLELISKGRGGIEAAMHEAERLGLAPSDKDLKQIEAADHAIKELTEAIKGLKQASAAGWPGQVVTQAAEFGAHLLGSETQTEKDIRAMIDKMPEKQFRDFAKEYGYAIKYSATNRHPEKVLEKYFGITGPISQTAEEVLRQAAYDRWDELSARGGKSLSEISGMAGNFLYSVPKSISGRVSSFATGAWSGFGGIQSSGLAAMYRASPDAFWQQLFGPDAFKHDDFDERWNNLGGAEENRIANAIENIDRPWMRREAPPQHLSARGLSGYSTLEAGTAEAFRQERRSSLAGELGIQKQQLDEQKRQTKELQSIDTGIKNSNAVDKFQVVNIA